MPSPFDKPVVVARRRRGDPTPAEMALMSQAARAGFVELEHPKGADRPKIVELAFEMQERGWLEPPGEPHVVVRDVEVSPTGLPSEQQRDRVVEKRPVRVWRFRLADKGRQAYRDQLASFGVR